MREGRVGSESDCDVLLDFLLRLEVRRLPVRSREERVVLFAVLEPVVHVSDIAEDGEVVSQVFAEISCQ